MRFASAVTLAALILMTTIVRADLIGHYKVSGTTPDGSPYSGEVAAEFVGNTFHVVREIGGQRYIGTGIGNKNVLAVTYRLDEATLLALYVQDESGRWTGTWTYVDGNQIGTERWQPYSPHQSESHMPR